MSTTVKILIIVGTLVISLVSYFVCKKIEKKIDNGNVNIANGFFKCALIISLLYFLTYSDYIFLYTVKIYFFVMGWIVVDVFLIGVELCCYLIYKKFSAIAVMFVIVTAVVTVSIMLGTTLYEDDIQKNSIEVTNKIVETQKVEPYINNSDKGIFVDYNSKGEIFSCKFYYIEDNLLKDKELKAKELKDIVYLKDNEDTYIEVSEISTDYINHEAKSNSEKYKYTENETEYVLYINESQIVTN